MGSSLGLSSTRTLCGTHGGTAGYVGRSLTIIKRRMKLPFDLSVRITQRSFTIFALGGKLSVSIIDELLNRDDASVARGICTHFLPRALSTRITGLDKRLVGLTVWSPQGSGRV